MKSFPNRGSLMRTRILIILVFGLPVLSGCSLPDALFGVFGDHYTGGGTTRIEKKRDYDRYVEASREFASDR